MSPLPGPPSFSSSPPCCTPAAPADAIQSSSSPKHFLDSANAPSWAGTYSCIGLLLLRSGRQTTGTVTRRSPLRTHRHAKTTHTTISHTKTLHTASPHRSPTLYH